MNQNVDTLIIIGNGFDIANNFPTQYIDFIASSFFTSLLKSNMLSQYIYQKKEMQNWVDVEMELANYSNLLWKQYNGMIPVETTTRFEQEFLELRESLFHYIVNVQCSSKSNPAMEALVEEWLDELVCENKCAYILDFNYNIVDYRFFSRNISIQRSFYNGNPNQVHGIASPDRENRIVLGVDKTNIKCKEHSFLIKEYNQHTHDMGYFESVETATKVIIFGCSLGRTDYRYFKPLFTSKKDKIFKIYCYGEQEYKKIKLSISEYTDSLSLFLSRNKVSFYDSKSKYFRQFE